MPQDGTGFLRFPVTGGMAVSVTPLETIPAPVISGVTVTSTPPGLPGLSGRGASGDAWASGVGNTPGVLRAITRVVRAVRLSLIHISMCIRDRYGSVRLKVRRRSDCAARGLASGLANRYGQTQACPSASPSLGARPRWLLAPPARWRLRAANFRRAGSSLS